jgi:hypothetical protein
MADSKRQAAPIRYESPIAVFNAFREARSKGNWEKCFSTLSPSAQDDAVFEMFFACAEADSSQSRAVLSKVGLDEGSLSRRLEAKMKELGDSAPEASDPRRADRGVLREVVCAQIRDKTAFYVAVRNLFEGKSGLPPLGDLEDLVIEGNVATGRAKTILSYIGSETEKADRVVESESYRSFNFRMSDRGWLIDPP